MFTTTLLGHSRVRVTREATHGTRHCSRVSTRTSVPTGLTTATLARRAWTRWAASHASAPLVGSGMEQSATTGTSVQFRVWPPTAIAAQVRIDS